jgi:hypothetical protein
VIRHIGIVLAGPFIMLALLLLLALDALCMLAANGLLRVHSFTNNTADRIVRLTSGR